MIFRYSTIPASCLRYATRRGDFLILGKHTVVIVDHDEHNLKVREPYFLDYWKQAFKSFLQRKRS